MSETKKTAVIVLVMLGISFGIIFSYVYAFESGFLSRTYYDKESENILLAEKKIAIIGSSQIAILNPSEVLKQNNIDEKKVGIYNLFVNADNHIKRLESIDDVLELEPDYVLYGVGLNSFGWGNVNNMEIRDCVHIKNRNIPSEIQKVLDDKPDFEVNELVNSQINENILDKEFFKTINPKQLTIEIIKKSLFSSSKSLENKTSDSSIYEIQTKLSINELERIDSEDFGICLNNFEKQYNSLINIIDKFEEEQIKVIFFIPPYDVEFFTYMPKSVEDSLRNTIISVAEEKNLEFYDLSHSYDGLDVFKDITHMKDEYASLYYSDIGIIIKEIDI